MPGMIPLPIAHREMLVLAKSPALYRGRIVLSILLLLFGVGLGMVYHFAGIMVARQFLPMIGFGAAIYCLFAGAQATADSISVEKREGTLGLLYLTHMRTGQILFGKLIAHTLLVFYGLLIAVPLLSFLLLLGGVQGSSLLKLVLGALNALFFSAAIGLFCSSFGVQRRRVQAMASWIIIAFWILPGAAAASLHAYNYPRWMGEWVVALNPAAPLSFIGGPVPRMGGQSPTYWGALLLSHGAAWLFLLGAFWFLPRRWQDSGAASGKRTLKERWRQFCYGGSVQGMARRRRFLEVNPFFWLSARHRFKPVSAWLFFLMLLGFLTFVLWQARWEPGVILVLTIGLTLLQRVVFAGASTARLNEEHEQGTLELLLSTPLQTREIVRGNMKAVLWHLRGPSLILAAVHALWLLFLFMNPFDFSPADLLEAEVIGAVFLVLHYLNLFTLTRLGLWSCVTVKNPKKAPSTAIGNGVFLPVVGSAVIFAITGLAVWYFNLRFEPEWWHFFGVYFVLALANDLFWLSVFRRAFSRKLREFASKRFEPQEKPGLIERLAGLRIFRRTAAAPPVLRA